MKNLKGFKATKQSGKLKVESGKLNIHKSDRPDRSDKSDECISKSSQINIIPKQHNVKDSSDLSDLSYLSDFKQKTAFTLAEVKGMFPLPGRGLGRGGDLKSSEQELSPSLKFVSSLVLDLLLGCRRKTSCVFCYRKTTPLSADNPLHAHRVRFRHFVPVSSICSLSGFRSLCSLHPYANPPFANKFFSLPRRDRKCAFTLAEVLVTLGVIGVIAAMTLPNVIKNYQKQVTVNKLKSTYTLFSQAVQKSVEDNGDVASWDRTQPKLYAERYINPYFKGVKKISLYKVLSLHKKGEHNYWNRYEPTNVYQLPNGVSYMVRDGIGTTVNYIYIIVDLNGPSKPNIMGKDVFGFNLSNQNSKLIGSCSGNTTRKAIMQNEYSACSKTFLGNDRYAGLCCSGLVMHDGWKILDDYPW